MPGVNLLNIATKTATLEVKFTVSGTVMDVKVFQLNFQACLLEY